MLKCACGCGDFVTQNKYRKNKFIHGHNRKGIKLSEEIRLKMSGTRKSYKSSGKPRKFRKLSEEIRLKISKSLKGFKRPPRTEEHNKKQSDAHKGQEAWNKGIRMWPVPEQHPSWKGGIAYEPYCNVWGDEEFKKDIKKRDDYKCQNSDCWGKTDRLCVHHIDYDKKNCHPNNLLTLCLSCNARANFNRKFWESKFAKV